MRVLIVGVGIAGPTLAYWLQRLGHRPTLVEWAPEPRRGGYLVDFWGAGFDVAERMGIVRALRRSGYQLREARAVCRGGRRIASFKPSTFVGSGDRYVTLARSDLASAERVLTTGHADGAVRDDLPNGLLIAIALGMGRAMDIWLMNQEPDDDALPPLISGLVGMIRRALQP